MSDNIWMFGKRSAPEGLAALGGNFTRAAAFLMRTDLEALPPGRVEIDGERIFAIVNGAADLVAPENRKTEVHAAYGDIQVPLSGEETYGVAEIGADEFAAGTKASDDLWFLEGVKVAYHTLQPGDFAVFFPKTCAHAPAVSLTGPRRIRKIVVKVRV